MFTDNNLSRNPDNADDKTSFSDHKPEGDGHRFKQSKVGNLGSQELTLSYLCDNSKMEFQDKGNNLFTCSEKERSCKGKQVISPDSPNEQQRWVERDFLQLNGVSGKRENHHQHVEETDKDKKDKKPKLETLDLSLSLPDVSLFLNSPNPFPKSDNPPPPPLPPVSKPTRSTQSLVPSNNNTRTGSSDDFTGAPSMSYSYSHQISHNPSCSLTRNSTDFYEYSVGSHRRETDPIWNCGEGTNGSVHSRFKPVGDSIIFSSHLANGNGNVNANGNINGNGNANSTGTGTGNSNTNPLMQGIWPINKDSGNNSLYRPTGSENHSFFPSELPARPMKDTQSGDSRGRAFDRPRGIDNSEGGRARRLTRPERLLREVVSESIVVMAQVFQELPDEIIVSTKEYLKSVVVVPEKSEELSGLQKRLERRSDLTIGLLSKSHKAQLDILVTIKTGLANYLSVKNGLPMGELVEIFLQSRCRNVNCKSILPVEDCDCKICSTKKGFCSACMCPVCLNFDCASNTCSWVGCDVCSHWCHAICGIERNLIKPGPSLRGSKGTMEMQFHCLGCGHASEMFGFVKDVFVCCAKDWGLETLIKELDCVRKIFRGSEDPKGKELQYTAAEMLDKLENKIILPSDACNAVLQFFKYGKSEVSGSGIFSKDLVTAQMSQNGIAVSGPPSTSVPPKSSSYNMNSCSRRDILSLREVKHQNQLNALMSDRTVEEELQSNILVKNGFDSLESIVQIKEAEARMFQSKADDARREAEQYRRMARSSSEKLEEEYTSKLSKLCLKETEEKRRKKLEELKALDSSHIDYYNMKIRMQAEIAGLLERMEQTKQQWV